MSGFMLYYKAGGREIMDPRYVRKETEIRVALLKLLDARKPRSGWRF